MGKRAFSLLELVCACGILATILAVMIFSSGGTLNASAHQSAASLVETELKAARERAMGEQKLVAVVMRPSAGPEIGVETGVAGPRLERVTSLAREFRGAWIQTGALATPAPSDPRVPAPWFDASRAALIFTPSGRVLSNLQADAQGRFALELGNSGQAQWKLTVDPGGLVTSERLDGSAPAALAAPLSRSASSNSPPRFESLDLDSSAAVKRVGGVLQATVRPQSLLTLRVRASDPDGDEQLFCSWSGGGDFSQPVRAPLQFDPGSGMWTGSVTWRPPSPQTAALTLRCEVTDRSGERARNASGALATTDDSFKLVVNPPVAEQVVLPFDIFDEHTSICALNPDGSGLRSLWRGTEKEKAEDKDIWETYPTLSPDGTQVAYVAKQTWPPDLVVRNVDGTNRRVLFEDWWSTGQKVVFWNATGDSLYYTRNHPTISGTGQLVKVRADGSDRTNPTVVVANRKTDHTWVSPDHSKIVWVVRLGYPNDMLELIDLNTGQVGTVATAGGSLGLITGSGSNALAWLPDSSGFVYGCTEGGQTKLKRGTAAFPPVSTTLLSVSDCFQLAIASNGQLAFSANWGRAVYTCGTVASPGPVTGPVLTYSTNYLYSGGAAQISFGREGRYLYYVQGPTAGSKILRYDTQTSEVLELGRGLRTSSAATGAGGATDLELLLDP